MSLYCTACSGLPHDERRRRTPYNDGTEAGETFKVQTTAQTCPCFRFLHPFMAYTLISQHVEQRPPSNHTVCGIVALGVAQSMS